MYYRSTQNCVAVQVLFYRKKGRLDIIQMASEKISLFKHVSDSMDKIRSKPWAEPLGKALGVSAKIVGGASSFIPGANILGGALAFGSTLLNPEPTNRDLQKNLQALSLKLNKSEIKTDFGEINDELMEMFERVGNSNAEMTSDINQLKDRISQTFRLVTETRYKVRFKFLLCIVGTNVI